VSLDLPSTNSRSAKQSRSCIRRYGIKTDIATLTRSGVISEIRLALFDCALIAAYS
jgi:hypothetical protein